MEFYIVDAFSNISFGGNPAGVLISKEDLTPDIMQKIAAEVRFSETAFVKQIDETSFQVKFFTPNTEIELCGHATISIFEVLRYKKLVEAGNTYKMQCKAGTLDIFIDENHIMMEQSTPLSRNSVLNIEEICETLNIDVNDVGTVGYDLKPEVISTGVWDIMFPVKSEQILNKISPDFSRLSELSKKYDVVGLHAFTLDTNDQTSLCRNFAPLYGINEEAATGTSNGALTYYLYKNNIIKPNDENIYLQGQQMNRPSLITGKLQVENGKIKILVGGTSKILLEGEFFI